MGGRHLKPYLSVYGHVTVDTIFGIDRFLPPGITADALSKKTALGGTGTNIAVTAARLGCPTALCAFIGHDIPGAYLTLMEESGLIMDEVETVDLETSSCVIINDSELVTRIFFFQGPQGCADTLGITLDRNARQSEHVHFCTGQPSYYLGLMRGLRGGPSITFDPAQEVHKLWNAELVREAVPMSDALFCNELEAKTICEHLGIDDILDARIPLVVRTDGDRGSVARVGDEVISIPLVEAARAVDVTGAGDSYRAGFYTALYRGYDVPEALVIASSVASFIVEEVGALTNTPTWEMALERAEPYFGSVH